MSVFKPFEIELEKPPGCHVLAVLYSDSGNNVLDSKQTLAFLCGDRRTETTGRLLENEGWPERDIRPFADVLITGFCVNCPNQESYEEGNEGQRATT